MTTKTTQITDVTELRHGDIATFNYGGYEYTGPIVEGIGGSQRFMGREIRYNEGVYSNYGIESFVSATREVPALPTEPLSVITDVVIKEGTWHGTLAMGVCVTRDAWHLFNRGGASASFSPEEIVSFKLAKVVPA